MMDINIQKQHILKAALEVFTSKGYNGATIGEIAAEAGVNPAIIYRHFHGKLELFSALGRPELNFPDLQEEKIRSKIRKAAIRVFSQKGYAAATMDEIAANVELSKAGVYFYYPSKEDLFKAALENSPGFPAIEQAVKPLQIGNDSSLEEALTRLAQAYLSLFRNNEFSSLIRIVLSEGVRDPNIAGYFQEKAIRAGSEFLAGSLNRNIDLDPEELSARVKMFFGMMFSWGLVNVLFAPGGQIDDTGIENAARALTRQFIHGIYPYVRER